MCYTEELLDEETGITVVVSDCFGVGFKFGDMHLHDAIEKKDAKLWRLLSWMIGGALGLNRVRGYEHYFLRSPSPSRLIKAFEEHLTITDSVLQLSPLDELIDSPYTSDWAREIVDKYLSGRLREEAELERGHKTDKKPKKGEQGHVYLIRTENNLYKIGKARDINARLKPFGVNFPMKWELIHSFPADDYSIAEALLHEMFSDKQEVGEWFSLDPDDVVYVSSLHGFKDGDFTYEQ